MNICYLIKPTDTDEWEQTDDAEIMRTHLEVGAEVICVMVGVASRVTGLIHDSLSLSPLPEAKEFRP